MKKTLGKSLPEILKEQDELEYPFQAVDNIKIINAILDYNKTKRNFKVSKASGGGHVIEYVPFSCVPHISIDLKDINKRNEGCF